MSGAVVKAGLVIEAPDGTRIFHVIEDASFLAQFARAADGKMVASAKILGTATHHAEGARDWIAAAIVNDVAES